MNRLIQEQADGLRGARRRYGAAVAALHEVWLSEERVCPHDEHHYPGCPVCHLNWLIDVARDALEAATRFVDTALEAGPAPRGV